MNPANSERIRELLRRLEALDARCSRLAEAGEIERARAAIFEELDRLARAEGLALFRRGDSFHAVSMAG